MTFKQLKQKIKEERTELALTIRLGKFYRKPHRREDMPKEHVKKYCTTYGTTTYYNHVKIENLSDEYRHKHIAYCHFFNGTDYGLIENPRKNNKRNQKTIDKYIEIWEGELDEPDREAA